jgi:hypothetical protein
MRLRFWFLLFRTDTTRSSDTMNSVLQRLNIDDAAVASFCVQTATPTFYEQVAASAGGH